ncbi:hypothetical protein ACFRU3_09590 [Streptomyces sp. NPDC056910]
MAEVARLLLVRRDVHIAEERAGLRHCSLTRFEGLGCLRPAAFGRGLGS